MHETVPDFARSLARSTGELILEARRAQGLETSFKDGTELVTDADVKADRYICDAIRMRYPGHRILAEESAPDVRALSGFDEPLWIIDPIDGTVNYAHGHPQSAVSIAYAERGQIQCGVVYNPFADELFYATQGGGAWCNDERIHCADKTELRRALIATGFPYVKSREILAPIIRRLALVLEECGDIRRLGSAALDICWVAMGRLDGYYESLSIWDFAAAQLIAREAGAQYGHFKPVPAGVSETFHHEHILVANPQLFPLLKGLLNRADDIQL